MYRIEFHCLISKIFGGLLACAYIKIRFKIDIVLISEFLPFTAQTAFSSKILFALETEPN